MEDDLVALAIEEHDTGLWLVQVNCQDEPRMLACFATRDAAEAFKREFNLAKLCAHAAGASGI